MREIMLYPLLEQALLYTAHQIHLKGKTPLRRIETAQHHRTQLTANRNQRIMLQAVHQYVRCFDEGKQGEPRRHAESN